MQVIFQSGGLGTRLYPETLNKPKCFLKVNNKTILRENLASGMYFYTLKAEEKIVENGKIIFR